MNVTKCVAQPVFFTSLITFTPSISLGRTSQMGQGGEEGSLTLPVVRMPVKVTP